MSLQWQLPRDVPADTAQVAQVILRAENVYRQIGDRFNDLFPFESHFAKLYKATGRGAISPLLLALVTVFQMLEKVPDRVAAEYVVSRIDWKYALHLPLAYSGFHFCDLSAFRQRLLEQQRERLVFEDFIKRLKSLGLIKARGKVRTDSTHILAVVERLSQLELVTESIRVALGAVTKVAADWVEQHLPASFREAYEARQSEYGLSQTQVLDKLIKAGQDGFWFLAQVEQSSPPEVRKLPEVETLRTVLNQQFPSGPGGPPAVKRPSGVDVIESPHETEARRGTKRGKGWIGYKTHVTETCEEDSPHLIVDMGATDAVAHDSPELPKIQTRLQAQGTMPGEQYVDSGYISGKHIADSQKAGIDLKGMPLGDTHDREGFRQADFQIDEDTHQATCPAGETATVWSERHAAEGEPAGVQIRFDAATCKGCRFFGQCTTSARGRTLGVHPYRKVLEARRAEAETESYQTDMHKRAGIESTISELVRGHRMRYARYRGTAKLLLQNLFIGIAVNLKRLARWWKRTMATQKGVDQGQADQGLAKA